MTEQPTNLQERNQQKPWGDGWYFHRVNCPAEIHDSGQPDPSDPLQSGFGYACGCQDPSEQTGEMVGAAIGQALFGAALATLIGAGTGAAIGAVVAEAQGEDAEEGAKQGAIAGAIVGGIFGLGVAAFMILKEIASNKLLQTTPSWVPLAAQGQVRALVGETEREIEGEILGSYQTWTDVPLWQYHRYFDWNFHVLPDPGFLHVPGNGNLTKEEYYKPYDPAAEGKEEEIIDSGGRRQQKETPRVLECEWDTGAFSSALPSWPGPLFQGKNLGWPMTGERLWAAGRWVYDCGHGMNTTGKRLDSKLFRAELHPLKAIAGARREAVQFEENDNLYVRGVRFTFFASRLGGYVEYENLGDKEYEFLVDIPEHTAGAAMDMRVVEADQPGSSTIVGTVATTHSIASDDGAVSVVQTRATKLLIRFDSSPWLEHTGERGFGKAASVTPKVEPVMDNGRWTRQMRVLIPLKEAASTADFFGVHVEFGWLDDQSHTLASRVRKFTLTFHDITRLGYVHDFGGELGAIEGSHEEWRVRYGVNGRWFQSAETELEAAGGTIALGDTQAVMHLDDDDQLRISVHGTEHDVAEDIFHDSKQDRTLMYNGQPVDFQRDIVRGSPHQRNQIAREIFAMMWTTFDDTNDPLGRKDLTERATQYPNEGVYRDRTLIAAGLRSNKALATTGEVQGTKDYMLRYTIEVTEQRIPLPAPPPPAPSLPATPPPLPDNVA